MVAFTTKLKRSKMPGELRTKFVFPSSVKETDLVLQDGYELVGS
jgi:hypothetical protein